MNREIEELLLNNGASMVGFAKVEGLYQKADPEGPRSEDSVTEPFEIPEYPCGISIVLAYPREIIRGISDPKTIQQPRCGSCKLCTDACPGGAISGRNWSPELDRDEFFDVMACRRKAREISAKALDKKISLCGKCIEVCPYTRRYTAAAQ